MPVGAAGFPATADVLTVELALDPPLGLGLRPGPGDLERTARTTTPTRTAAARVTQAAGDRVSAPSSDETDEQVLDGLAHGSLSVASPTVKPPGVRGIVRRARILRIVSFHGALIPP
jgi:hypothetical protein